MASAGFSDWYNALPKVSRVYITVAFLMTAAVSFGLVTPYLFFLSFDLIQTKFQIWRLVTNFLFLGPFSFPFLFQMVFLCQYAVSLEKEAFSGRSADFFYMLLVSGLVMVFGVYITDAGFPFLSHAMVMLLVYVWSKQESNMSRSMSFLGLFQFQAMYLPFVIMLFSVLMGQSPVMDIIGILVGHVYFFFHDIYPRQSGKQILETPTFIQEMFEDSAPARAHRGWGAGQRLG